ncbi:MAG: PAS domain-containing protein [Deltaproteobacteria bacterium]|nr:PAS domain-containing protein [Deltaproteobacteria bacterium]
MILKRSGKLFIPALSIMVAVAILLLLLIVFSIGRLHQDESLMEEALSREGLAIIKSVESGARIGMRYAPWHREMVSRLITSTAYELDLDFIGIFNSRGQLFASSVDHNRTIRLPPHVSHREVFNSALPVRFFTKDGSTFVVGKPFRPVMGREAMGKMPSMPGCQPGYEAGPRAVPGWCVSEPGRTPPGVGPPPGEPALTGELVILVGLKTEALRQAQNMDRNHVLYMALLLAVVGSAAFFFLFVIQNYYLVEKTLKNMTTYTTNVVKSMPTGLVALDDKGQVVTINEAAAAMFRLPEEQRHVSLSELLGPKFGELVTETKGQGRVLEEEIICRDSVGLAVPAAVSATRLADAAGSDLGTIWLFRDLRQVRELENKVRRSERLAAVGRLAAGVAHEIRNPLSSIKGFAQLFKKDFPNGTPKGEYLDIMIKEIDRLNRTITDLLTYAKPKPPNLKNGDLNSLVEKTLVLWKPDPGIKVVTELSRDILYCAFDEDQLTQVLLNLLLNAHQAVAAAGQITVATSAGPESGLVSMTVIDSGPGVNPEFLDRLFDPFFTTRDKGTGLGLAIVHSIVEAHGGTIKVHNHPSGGAVFTITLPEAAIEAEALASAQAVNF